MIAVQKINIMKIRDISSEYYGKKDRSFAMINISKEDISTVRHDPERLWRWAQIAAEEAERA